jgi:hypothetical protein
MRSMVSPIAGTALLRRHAFAPAAVAALGAALGLYQATSLTLGPAADREISVSLSTPSFDELSLPAPPAAQVLEAGAAIAGRVERSLAALTAATTEPRLSAAGLMRLVGPAPARPSTPAGPQAPASVTISSTSQVTPPAARSTLDKHAGSSDGVRPGRALQSASFGAAG